MIMQQQMQLEQQKLEVDAMKTPMMDPTKNPELAQATTSAPITMAEVMSMIPDENAPGELNADEQDSLQVGEQMQEDQEQMLAGKYKNAQELESAYLELQKKLGDEEPC